MVKLAKNAITNKPAIAYIVVLYRLGVGSMVPAGTSSINLLTITVFVARRAFYQALIS